MTSLSLPSAANASRSRIAIALGLACALAAGGVLWAQVGGDRGIAPVASSTDIEVHGIEVNVTGKNPEDARENGWREAQRLAWKKLGGPSVPDGRLNSMVSAIIVEKEELGPRRYIATLGVIFDRTRVGGLLGGQGERSRSAPMLTLPVTISGGVATMYETRTDWQRAWAEFQAGNSVIDYVRPAGAGGESLLLTYGQTGRRSRLWWNDILDQFGASDVLVPIADLRYSYPGGPVTGHFVARHGPDNAFLGEFELKVDSADKLPAMLAQAVRRFDDLFTKALAAGTLRPDPTLSMDSYQLSPEVLALIDAARQAEAAEAEARAAAAQASLPTEGETPLPSSTPPAGETAATIGTFVVQVATPDAGSFDTALTSVRSAPGVRGVAVNSTAIGGTSVVRVTFSGDLGALAAALRGRGWQVTQGSNALAISR